MYDFPNPRRSERATDTLPQTTAEAIFTITGGRIVLVQIVGEVTVAIQNQANNTKLIHNVGTGTDQDICAVLNIANDEVGTLYGISGVFADALIGSGQAVQTQLRELILKPGTIDLSCAASNTGSVKWSLFYRPLDRAAHVTST
jgi:hypothetical protein